MADSALRLISKTGREALDIENDMVRILGLADWVRAIASEPNMHAMRRHFNLTAVAPPFIFGDVAVGIGNQVAEHVRRCTQTWDSWSSIDDGTGMPCRRKSR